MTTLTTCRDLREAEMLQSVLRGSGVESFIPDEFTVQNDWLLINAIGGVRVQVDPDDLERANEILIEMQKTADESQIIEETHNKD